MNETYVEEAHQATKILTISCYFITFIVGIIGNGLVIWISGFRMKTISAVWFLNLAIADFIFCLCLPFPFIAWLTVSGVMDHIPDKEKFYISSHIIHFFMMNLNSAVSVTFLTAISVDRCVSIMWPLWAKVHRTRRLVRIVSVFLWFVPLTIVFFINTGLINHFTIIHRFYLDVPSLEELEMIYNVSLDSEITGSYEIYTIMYKNLFMFGIPFIIILICYGLIVYKLRHNRFKRPKGFQRTFRIIIAVVVCFFICWFPFNIWPLLAGLMGMSETLPDFIISNVCLCLISISSCINPILYVLLGHARRANYKKSIKVRLENAMSEKLEDS
ncbi:N-formyl peptide receptor 3-like [Aquarana catesbeiana]|uniref:N-formyl peptide receptor 3-like n=1 Tax=Aquarana catesbeiana TaxID=8400 RepID=UPI003CCA16E9